MSRYRSENNFISIKIIMLNA